MPLSSGRNGHSLWRESDRALVLLTSHSEDDRTLVLLEHSRTKTQVATRKVARPSSSRPGVVVSRQTGRGTRVDESIMLPRKRGLSEELTSQTQLI